MERKQNSLVMALCCAFFLLLSLAGLAAVFLTGEVAGVDALLLLMICAGMALLFAWLTFSALQGAGLFGSRGAPESVPAANPASAAKVEGK
jgi:hypothetical protein